MGLGFEEGSGFGLQALVFVGGCGVAGLWDLSGVLVVVLGRGFGGGLGRRGGWLPEGGLADGGLLPGERVSGRVSECGLPGG